MSVKSKTHLIKFTMLIYLFIYVFFSKMDAHVAGLIPSLTYFMAYV